VLRPATVDSLTRLQLASSASDRELDRALSDVGILPPLDLSAIRNVLGQASIELSTTRNADGHVVVAVTSNTMRSAVIHHDGRVHVFSAAAA